MKNLHLRGYRFEIAGEKIVSDRGDEVFVAASDLTDLLNSITGFPRPEVEMIIALVIMTARGVPIVDDPRNLLTDSEVHFVREVTDTLEDTLARRVIA